MPTLPSILCATMSHEGLPRNLSRMSSVKVKKITKNKDHTRHISAKTSVSLLIDSKVKENPLFLKRGRTGGQRGYEPACDE